MQKFTEFVNEHKASLKSAEKASNAHKFNELYESKLKSFGVSSPLELNEEQSKEFFGYLQNLKVSELNEGKMLTEADIKDEKSFREYAESVLKKAHGDKYDESIAKKVVDGIISKMKGDDWGEAIGRLTAGLGK